jgi:hypothetical protein
MLADTNDRPSLEEQYLLATSSSNLTLNPDRTCAATHLIAAGLTGNRMGEALSHLRSEWQSAGKPRKATEAEILKRAETLPKLRGKPDVKRARTVVLVEHAAAMRKRAHQLLGWAPTMRLLLEWAVARGIEPDILSPALYHWLAPACPVCDGHGQRKLPDAPVLSTKRCNHCAGTGKWPRPPGAEVVHDWLQRCAGKAKHDRGALVRGAPIFDR